MGEDQGGLTPEQQAGIRALALDTLVAFRDGGSIAAPMPTGPDLKQILEFMAGGLEIDEYLPMMREELALTADLRAPRWHKDDVNPDKPFKVVIIGAGMSGIVAAYRLAEADVPYVVIDKNADVGGTWLENSYPGCRVDIPNHYYSYSFAQRDDWPLYYSPRAELYKYFRECVDEFGIRPNIRFNTEVSSVEYDDETATWTVCTVDKDGREANIQANAVISAVGQLNRPQLPKIEGRESFAGPAFHSARWDHYVDLTGKRVGVIGTGCSAAQFGPIVAEQVEHLEIFQRTPNWQFPVPHYRHEVPAGLPVPARATCRTTASGTASGCSGRAPSCCARWPRSIPTGPTSRVRSARATTMLRELLTEALVGAVPGAPRPAGEGAAAVPAGGQADHRRRRHVGGDAAPRQRHADDDGRSSGSCPRASSRSTASCTSSTSCCTAPASSRRSS